MNNLFIDLWDFIKSRLFSTKGMYVAYWIDFSKVGTIADMAKGDVIIHPVTFDGDESIELLPSPVINSPRNIEAPLKEPFVLDPIRGIAYILGCRLFGGDDKCSYYSRYDQKLCEAASRKNFDVIIGSFFLKDNETVSRTCLMTKIGAEVTYSELSSHISPEGKNCLEGFKHSLGEVPEGKTMDSKVFQKKWFDCWARTRQ